MYKPPPALLALLSLVMAPPVATAQKGRQGRLLIVHENRADELVEPVSFKYLLDDVEIGTGKSIRDPDIRMFEQQVPVGVHRLSVQLDFAVKRKTAFPYLKDYKFHVRLRFAFSVEENKSTEIAVTAYRKEGALLKLEERLGARYVIARSLSTAAGRSDRDHDHVADDADECPNEAGSTIAQGCPDRDGDGIADAKDKCPSEPETFNGFQDDDGCPDQVPVQAEPPKVPPDAAAAGPRATPAAVVAEERAITVSEVVRFEFNDDQPALRSRRVLDQIVRALGDHPGAQPLRIEGHTDDVGSDAYNQGLSERRAHAVASYLTAKGLDGARFQIVGFGKQKPAENGITTRARSLNRRVEIALP
jgi:outer membrane protein OmpA-like peptidoglycan-associated protein